MRFARVLLQYAKSSTGLTGIAVAKHPHKTLTVLYEKTLRVLEAMPTTSAYRKNTEAIINQRLNAVRNTEPMGDKAIGQLEESINCGQAEELIQQAERELQLARRFLVDQPWQPLIGQAPEGQWVWPPLAK